MDTAKWHRAQSRRRMAKCFDPGSNQGPSDLQSDALPTELSKRRGGYCTHSHTPPWTHTHHAPRTALSISAQRNTRRRSMQCNALARPWMPAGPASRGLAGSNCSFRLDLWPGRRIRVGPTWTRFVLCLFVTVSDGVVCVEVRINKRKIQTGRTTGESREQKEEARKKEKGKGSGG